MQRIFKTVLAGVAVAFIATLGTVRADDLDIIVAPGTSPEEQGQAYYRLSAVEFASIAPKLATLIGQHLYLASCSPTKEPWTQAWLSESDRSAATLHLLWSNHTQTLRPEGERLKFMLPLLENPSLGRGRELALSQISMALHWGRIERDPSIVPLIPATLQALDRIARNPKEDASFRQRAVTTLFEEGDPNLYLALVIELTSQEATPLQCAERFRFCTPISRPTKLNAENYNRYLRHGFELLEAVDDGKSGTGYFLALHLGAFIGMPTPSRGPGPGLFAPERLPKYEGKHGLTQEFFQDTVNNARKWWEENRARFEPSTPTAANQRFAPKGVTNLEIRNEE